MNEFAYVLANVRKAKGLTQEEACELIGVSDTTTLSKWENGVTTPSEKMVKKIVQAYKDKLIAYIYLQQCSELGQLLLPQIDQGDLPSLVLRFKKEYKDIVKIDDEMIEVACDGVVEEYERETWDISLKEIRELMGSCIPLLIQDFSDKSKKPSQGGNLERAIV